MLANCCAVIPVSFRMVGARAARIVRWKKESHEHAAMARHGTHICHVTDGPAAAVAVTVFTPVVVDIDFSRITLPFRLRRNWRIVSRPRSLQRRGSSDRAESETPVRRRRLSQRLPMWPGRRRVFPPSIPRHHLSPVETYMYRIIAYAVLPRKRPRHGSCLPDVPTPSSRRLES